MLKKCTRRDGGFTLAELLVVLLLIGIFTGIIIVEMRGTFTDALLRSSAREVMSGLSLAGSRAVSLNQSHSFELNRTERTFSVRSDQKGRGSENEDQSSETGEIDERITVEIRDPAEVTENEQPEPSRDEPPQGGRDVIRFYPDGTADAREIILRDNNNGELVLRINPITGRVRVQEEETLE
jgi:type II secretion system protein H